MLVALTVVVLLLGVLVAGLLRSHADILRALHSLGAGVGDPALEGRQGDPSAVPVTMGPTLPPERNSSAAPTVAGVTPGGEGLAVPVGSSGSLTLLAFLTTGCASCAGFWRAFRAAQPVLPEGVDLLIVTKGPKFELPGEVVTLAGRATVVMSDEAWTEYEVPGSPFFALIDGRSGRRIGEGVANHVPQLQDLLRRATAEHRPPATSPVEGTAAVRANGPERELGNDEALLAAGIRPGDPSLYPRTLDDLYGPSGGAPEGAV